MNTRSQKNVLQKIYNYLEMKGLANEYYHKICHEGQCLKLCYLKGLLRLIKYPISFETIIDEMGAWNGQTNALQIKIPKNQPIITLDQLFQNIVFLLNPFEESKFFTYQLHEQNWFLPDGPLQKMAESNHFPIKSNIRMAGHFDKNDLENCLNDRLMIEALQNNICIVQNLKHACELTYRDNKWELYDPNHGVKRYSELNDLIAELTRILGDDLCFEMISSTNINNNIFSYYNKLLQESPEKLFYGNGLSLITKHIPQYVALLASKLPNLGALSNEIQAGTVSPYFFSIEAPDVSALKIFLDTGADFNWERKGENALSRAIYLGNESAVKILIDYCNVRGVNYAKEASLEAAVLNGYANIVKILLEQGANPNNKNPDGWTPLMIAAQNNRSDVVRTLLLHGADTTIRNNGLSAMDLAIEKNNIQIVQILNQHHSQHVNVTNDEKNKKRKIIDLTNEPDNKKRKVANDDTTTSNFFSREQSVTLFHHQQSESAAYPVSSQVQHNMQIGTVENQTYHFTNDRFYQQGGVSNQLFFSPPSANYFAPILAYQLNNDDIDRSNSQEKQEREDFPELSKFFHPY